MSQHHSAMPATQSLANSPDLTGAEHAHLRQKAQFIRLETIRLIEIAKVGHYSSVFSAAEIFAALYYDVMSIHKNEPNHPDRDRFLMGKGHAAVGLFPILEEFGYISKETLDGYTRLGNPLGDHPDMRKVPGVDFSSGSIGHALSAGAGIAWGGRFDKRSFNVFVMLGDGEMQEGQVWEAALFAAQHKLSRLITIIDRNGYQLDGAVDDVIAIEPLAEKWCSFGWEAHEVDGHNLNDLTKLLRELKADDSRQKPVCVIARTLKGKGVSYMETEPGWHLGYLDPADAQRAIDEIKSKEI